MYDAILVATDGSVVAKRAVTDAIEQVERFDAVLHGIYVVDVSRVPEPAMRSAELSTHERERRGEELLEEIATRAGDLELEFVSTCCHGLPHPEIIAYADEIDADLIVLGYQGQSHTRGKTIGSITDRVVRGGGRPVLVT